jgi:hypothetical protein
LNREILLIGLFLLGLSSGCLNADSNEAAPEIDLPPGMTESQIVLATAEYYAKAAIDERDYEKVYSMLSKDEKPEDFDKWIDDKQAVGDALVCGGVSYDFLIVADPIIEGDTAEVEIKYNRIIGETTRLRTKKLSMVKEGNSWRVNSDITFT